MSDYRSPSIVYLSHRSDSAGYLGLGTVYQGLRGPNGGYLALPEGNEPPVGGWVLFTGVWNDSAFWDDDAIWRDEP